MRMSGGNKVVGLWRDRVEDRATPPDLEDVLIEDREAGLPEWDDEPDTPRVAWIDRLTTPIAIAVALAIVAAFGWERYRVLGLNVGLADVTAMIGAVAAPLALVAILWLVARRSSTSEQRRFAGTSAMIDGEARRLEALFAVINARIALSRAALEDEASRLMTLGDDAASRLASITRAMDGEIETVTRHSQMLTNSASSARGDLAVLLSSMPKANVQMRELISALQQASVSAHEQAGALDAQLSLLTVRGREADETAGNAAQKLAAHLARMESVSEVAGARLEAAAGQMTEAVDSALDRAGTALDTARQGMEAQGAAMMALVGQNQAALAQVGDEAAASLQNRISEIAGRIADITTSLADQDNKAQALSRQLVTDIDALGARFAQFDHDGSARIERLGVAIQALRDHSDDMTRALSGSGDSANSLAERAQSLMTALGAIQNEVDEVLPASFARLETSSVTATSALAGAAPQIRETAEHAADAVAKLQTIGDLIATHRAAVEQLTRLSTDGIGQSEATADAVLARIKTADAALSALTDETLPKLQSTLTGVTTASDAAGRAARSALDDAVTSATQLLGSRTRDALNDALTRQVEEQLAAIAETTQTAVASAQAATDRLMRQMLTISETSAALEARVADAKTEIERGDQANFARRVALLIESLNSTAIDVTKILSNEVTDTAWAAYLRGDRGVFSRRAVKLLDNTQVREIALHYEHEPDFREQVNRYIHDFESMLRNVLATRDGQLLGVTLLSSDNGKLYVALAQAIERLRT
jgi:hypothetical protein